MNDYLAYRTKYSNELYHYGVKGQKWGIRRYQNPDGSLTEKGKRRMKTLQGKSDKLDAKKAKLNSPKNMVRLSQYKSLSADRHAAANQHTGSPEVTCTGKG